MALDSRPNRRRFISYDEDARQQLIASGLTPEQIVTCRDYGLLATDNVTGFWEGRSGPGRVWTLRHAIQHVMETGEQAIYVEMDLQNLGGLNAVLGHTNANEVFAKMAAIARTELSAVAAEASFFRHGGDETSAFLINASEPAVRQAVGRIQQQVGHVARTCGVHDIPHPKYGSHRRVRGTGIHFGICVIRPEHHVDPTIVFREADRDLEQNKQVKLPNDARDVLYGELPEFPLPVDLVMAQPVLLAPGCDPRRFVRSLWPRSRAPMLCLFPASAVSVQAWLTVRRTLSIGAARPR